MRLCLGAAVLMLAAATPVAGQGSATGSVVTVDGPAGASARVLRSALGAPHILLRGRDRPSDLPRDSVFARTVLVVGGDATVGSVVHGDVIVVGGDLFLHPGAIIDGRAVAIGGGVYNSTLALVRGGHLAFRDHTYDWVDSAGGPVLRYRRLERHEPIPVLAPLGFRGLGLPAYDRANGVSLPAGVVVTLDSGRYEAEVTGTYRSDLGAVDPGAVLRVRLTDRTAAELRALRGTLTNERWIRGDFLNGLTSLVTGGDVRNYRRADLAEARLTLARQRETIEFEPFIGARLERSWSVGPSLGERGAPWSLLDRHDVEEGMLRPNPAVARGTLASALAGAAVRWESQGVVAALAGEAEYAPTSLDRAPYTKAFTQVALDGGVSFPTFRSQHFQFFVHALVTAGDSAPPQRWSYLGGPGTLPTFELLEFGGDQLLFAESQYVVPIDRVVIKILGTPTVALRHMIGSAGVGRLPALEQNLGLRLTLGFFRTDFVLDPATQETDLSFALAFFR